MTNELMKEKAWEYAEKYGVIDFELENDKMIYERNYYLEGCRYVCTVDLNTMKETRECFLLKGGRK